jgi:hypothetical protein
LKDLVQTGDPPFIESFHRALSRFLLISVLSDVAHTIPAAAPYCGEDYSESVQAITDLVSAMVGELEVSREDTWRALLDEAGVEPDASVFPELGGPSATGFDPESWDEIGPQVMARVREALQRECSLTAETLIEFDRRFEWLNRRYRISDGEVRNQRFRIVLAMPGELLETNADTVVDGRARWSFTLRDFLEEDLTIEATSRVRRDLP